MLNIIGWIGNIGFLLGAIFLAKKWLCGWHFQIIGNVCYVAYAILLGFKDGVSLLVLSLILIIVNIFGLKNWKGNNKKWINIKN